MATKAELAKRYVTAKRRVYMMEAELVAAEAEFYLEAAKKEPDQSETWKKNYARSKVAPLMNKLAQAKGDLIEAETLYILAGGKVCE